jgi:hypothetical protein
MVKGNVLNFKFVSGEVDDINWEITALGFGGAAGTDYYNQYGTTTQRVDKISGNIITIGGSSYSVDADTLYFDYTETDPEVIVKGDLAVGDYVKIYQKGTKDPLAALVVVDAPAAASTVATPVATPAAGAVAVGTTVALSTATAGATIHYTTDGTDPTTASAVYGGPITINAAQTIKAIAVKAGMNNSAMLTAAYTLTESATITTPVLWNASATDKATIAVSPATGKTFNDYSIWFYEGSTLKAVIALTADSADYAAVADFSLGVGDRGKAFTIKVVENVSGTVLATKDITIGPAF